MHSYKCSSCNSYPEFSYCDTQFCYCSKPNFIGGVIVFGMFLAKMAAVLGVLLFLSCAASQPAQSCEEMVSTLILPLLERMEGILKNVEATLGSHETTEPSGNLPTAESDNSATAALQNFVTSDRYANSRMLTSNQNFFQSRLIPKEMPLIGARKNCSLACNKLQTCQAFNLYETNTYYVCEHIADNLWTSRSKLAFLSWTGGTVWEKKSTGNKELAYVDSKYKPGAQVPCEALKPGCSGNWPNCFNCVKHCVDSFARYPYQSRTPQNDEVTRETTLWPDGDQPFSVPIFGLCFEDRTFFLRRDINLSTNKVVMDYRMSLEDMSRLSRLNASPVLEFAFNGPNITNVWRSYRYEYDNWTIDAKGTLANMTFHGKSSSAIGDIFNLRGQPLKPTPFVTVNDDVYGCGSFWQLNDNYASLCPGGMVNMMGNVKFDRGGKIVNTGLSLPQSVITNEIIDYAHIRIRS